MTPVGFIEALGIFAGACYLAEVIIFALGFLLFRWYERHPLRPKGFNPFRQSYALRYNEMEHI